MTEIYPYGPEEYPEKLNEALNESAWERLRQIWDNPRGREGLKACGRLPLNVLISIADVSPFGTGEIPSWAADIIKIAGRVSPHLRGLDLTPDVGLGDALGSEGVELLTAGFAPSHAWETGKQIKADIEKGRFGDARNALGYLFSGKEDYLARLQEAQPELDQAAEIFEGGK